MNLVNVGAAMAVQFGVTSLSRQSVDIHRGATAMTKRRLPVQTRICDVRCS